MSIGVGKLIQQGTKENHQSLIVVLQSTSDCLMKKCVAVNMDKSGNCMPRGSKTMRSNQLLCGRGVPYKDELLTLEEIWGLKWAL